MIHGKRFWFATIAIICVTTVTIMLQYDGDTYMKLVATVVGIFIAGQTYTDARNGGKYGVK